MNKEIKQKWIKALRSGKYRQTTNKLRNHNGAMCCLGVLCDIQGAEWDHATSSWVGYQCSIKGSAEFSDTPRQYVAGIPKRIREKLMSMNDGVGVPKHSFAEIADYVEKKL